MEESKVFGIISEGPTDQIVIENILYGWTGDKDLLVTPLQPKERETGNWDKVFKYCKSVDFKQAFSSIDIVIIQIDTDFMLRGEVPEEYKIDMKDLNTAEVVTAFCDKFVELIGEEFYEVYQEQIIFAISVHEIECWFLPIYYSNKPKTANKTENCIDTLNRALPQQEGFYIKDKNEEYYEVISKYFRKKKAIKTYAEKNESLSIFIQELETKV